MSRSILLWITPLIAADVIANVILACAPPGAAVTYDTWGDAASTGGSNGASGSSSSAPGGSSNGGQDPPGASGSSGVGSSGGSGSGDPLGGSSGSPPPPVVMTDAGADAYVFPCGSTPCDLHYNTCCLPGDAGAWDAAYCVGGIRTACGQNIVTYHCLGAYDCPITGNLCCGVYDLTAQTAGTACQAGSCTNPQFCYVDAECGGPKCTKQSCQGVSPLYLCGLQSGPPYSCSLAP